MQFTFNQATHPSAMRANLVLPAALGLATVLAAPLELAERAEDIVGGTVVASATAYPFIAFMSNTDGYACGGTILSSKTIMTAAHCSFNEDTGAAIPASHYSFRVGSLKEASGGTVVKATSYTVHPKYSASTVDYDVVVFKLATTLTFGTTIGAAMLVASGSDPAAGTLTTTMGWGLTSESGTSISAVLREVDIPVIARTTCVADYGTSEPVTVRMFCAAASGKDSCSGDSGGPIINKSTKVLLGGVSWGNGCAEAAYPGVYSNYGNAEINSFIMAQIAALG
jgi:trypsin